MRYKHPNDKRIILCAVTAFVCLIAFVAVLLRMFAPDAPRILFIPFLLTAIGFLMSCGFLIRFCVERAKDKRNGVAIDRPVSKRPLTRAEIACIIVLVVSLLLFLVSIVFICYRGIIPDGVTAVLFVAGIAGYIAGSLWSKRLFVRQMRERANEKRLQKAGLLQIPEEDVIRKEIACGDEKGFQELEEYTLKFFENIVYPQGFVDFLKRYTAESDGEAEKKRFVERDGNDYEMADIYPPQDLIEINKNLLLYNDDYHTQFRDILFFADDESGHCHFLLDYGKGGEPKVKYLDDELDTVITLADSFQQFTEKLSGGKA